MRKNSPLASQRRPDYHKQVDARESNSDHVTLISELIRFSHAGELSFVRPTFPSSGTAVRPFSRLGSEEYYSRASAPTVKRFLRVSHHILRTSSSASVWPLLAPFVSTAQSALRLTGVPVPHGCPTARPGDDPGIRFSASGPSSGT